MKLLWKFFIPTLIVGVITFIYVIKVETWQLRKQAQKLQSNIEKEERAITILRAEKAYLLRPRRIERLARKHLKMRPPRPGQFKVVGE